MPQTRHARASLTVGSAMSRLELDIHRDDFVAKAIPGVDLAREVLGQSLERLELLGGRKRARHRHISRFQVGFLHSVVRSGSRGDLQWVDAWHDVFLLPHGTYAASTTPTPVRTKAAALKDALRVNFRLMVYMGPKTCAAFPATGLML